MATQELVMHDPQLKRLVAALDSAVEWAAVNDATGIRPDIEIARLRLHCLTKRLGTAVAASPYLSFVERLVAQDESGGRKAVAAGA
jgi:hypothetical protein